MSNPIELVDIEDVTIVIHAKGQRWLIIPRQGLDEYARATAKELRKLMILSLITDEQGMHSILDKPITPDLFYKIKQSLKNKQDGKDKESK